MKQINQTASQVFSFARFAALLKTYVVENGKTLSLYTAALIGISILVGAVIGYNCTAFDSVIMMTVYISIAHSICFPVSASFMFSSLQTRGSRISTFMLPASQFEKYMVRLTVYLLLFLACFVIAMLCGDCARLLTDKSGSRFLIADTMQLDYLFNVSKLSAPMVFKFISATLFTHAFYTLGSSLWPKHSFFKTFLIGMVSSIIIFSIFSPEWFLKYVSSYYENKFLIGVFLLILAIALYFLAWWRFSTTQIVQRFMKD
jgi:hypothetical protein